MDVSGNQKEDSTAGGKGDHNGTACNPHRTGISAGRQNWRVICFFNPLLFPASGASNLNAHVTPSRSIGQLDTGRLLPRWLCNVIILYNGIHHYLTSYKLQQMLTESSKHLHTNVSESVRDSSRDSRSYSLAQGYLVPALCQDLVDKKYHSWRSLLSSRIRTSMCMRAKSAKTTKGQIVGPRSTWKCANFPHKLELTADTIVGESWSLRRAIDFHLSRKNLNFKNTLVWSWDCWTFTSNVFMVLYPNYSNLVHSFHIF